MRTKILTKNTEIDKNLLEESWESIYDEYVRVANIGPEKMVWNIIFLILNSEYNNDGFLWWQDRKSKMYAAKGIWNLFFEFMICESDKTCVKYFVMGISWFICVYVWTSACLVPNCMLFLHNVCTPICIWSCYSAISYQSL